MKRSPIKRYKRLESHSQLRRSSLPRGSGLNPQSPKRRAQLVEFRLLRDDYLTQHPWCEFPAGCGQRATVVHHRRGRQGERLNDVRWFAASCDFHNDFAETHTGEALDLRWLVPIEGAA